MGNKVVGFRLQLYYAAIDAKTPRLLKGELLCGLGYPLISPHFCPNPTPVIVFVDGVAVLIYLIRTYLMCITLAFVAAA